jgi:hypothetical protein
MKALFLEIIARLWFTFHGNRENCNSEDETENFLEQSATAVIIWQATPLVQLLPMRHSSYPAGSRHVLRLILHPLTAWADHQLP